MAPGAHRKSSASDAANARRSPNKLPFDRHIIYIYHNNRKRGREEARRRERAVMPDQRIRSASAGERRRRDGSWESASGPWWHAYAAATSWVGHGVLPLSRRPSSRPEAQSFFSLRPPAPLRRACALPSLRRNPPTMLLRALFVASLIVALAVADNPPASNLCVFPSGYNVSTGTPPPVPFLFP